jgi:hypothetical protein
LYSNPRKSYWFFLVQSGKKCPANRSKILGSTIYNNIRDNNINTDKCLSIDNCRDNNLRARAREENSSQPVTGCNQLVSNCNHPTANFDFSSQLPHFDNELDCLDLAVFSDFENDSDQSASYKKQDSKHEYDETYYQTINDSMQLVEEHPKEPRKRGLERKEFSMIRKNTNR